MSTHEHRMRTSSVEPNWRTPKPCFDALNQEFAFTLDLAASADDALCPYWLGPGSPIPVPVFVGEPFGMSWENALTCSWMDAAQAVLYGSDVSWPVGFLNNPYSVQRYRETKNPAYLTETWAEKAWTEARSGFTTVAVMTLSPQTAWWRTFVEGHHASNVGACEVRRLPHRVKFDKADGSGPAENTGNVNIAIVIWRPDPGYVGPWLTPHRYWTWDGKWRRRNPRELTDDN